MDAVAEDVMEAVPLAEEDAETEAVALGVPVADGVLVCDALGELLLVALGVGVADAVMEAVEEAVGEAVLLADDEGVSEVELELVVELVGVAEMDAVPLGVPLCVGVPELVGDALPVGVPVAVGDSELVALGERELDGDALMDAVADSEGVLVPEPLLVAEGDGVPVSDASGRTLAVWEGVADGVGVGATEYPTVITSAPVLESGTSAPKVPEFGSAPPFTQSADVTVRM
ncbi:hypothetical protein EON62_01710 [archaeon]|nr:MAG: hypothetical protein EON62_01710 [archaeon]